MKMKSFSGHKKTNPILRLSSGQVFRLGSGRDKANFKRGGYAALRSAYKKSLFFAPDLVKWTLGYARNFEYRICLVYTICIG